MSRNYISRLCVWLLALGTAAFYLHSCTKESGYAVPRNLAAGDVRSVTLSIRGSDAPFDTKTLLTSTNIENKVTCATIAVYSDGTIVDKQWFQNLSITSEMSFVLPVSQDYTAYAFVNMGDLRSSIPSAETFISQMTYMVQDYVGDTDSVNEMGIPMSGSFLFTTNDEIGGTQEVTIPVSRLFAKVSVSLSCDWSGARIVSAKVCNMNKSLKPFGLSRANGSSSVLPFNELENASGVGSSTLSAVFYVPENLQGTQSIAQSDYKSPEYSSWINSRMDRLTYLEVEVETTGKYDGSVTYRSLLGANATTNFNIERNKNYSWTIHYLSDKVDDFTSDWKHVLSDLTVRDFSLSISQMPTGLNITRHSPTDIVPHTSSTPVAATLTRHMLYPIATSSSTQLPVGDVTWTIDDPTIATIDSQGYLTALKAGTTTLRASYIPSGNDYSEITASATITVQTKSYSFQLNPVKPNGTYSSPAEFKAILKTFIDGVETGSEDVSALATWDVSQIYIDSYYSVDSGIVTATPDPDEITIAGEPTVEANYTVEGWNFWAETQAEFVDVTEKAVSIHKSNGDKITSLKIAIGEGRNLLAKCITTTNGIVASSGYQSATWSSSDPDIVDVNTTTVIYALAEGVATIRATIDANSYAEIPVTVIAWQDDWDDDSEIIL